MDRADDAGVYKLSEDLAIIQPLDFFTPIVDDPYMFGQIAAANSLSDVYAMGGQPLTAMNIVCFPIKTMDISVLREILRGGLDKMKEAGVTLAGGHSVEDPELKYGLSVTGTIHPSRVLTNVGAEPGDVLILTKPLGTGIINTAIKAGMATEELAQAVADCMARLNKAAAEVVREVGARACTDVTGFGLVGHAFEMIQGTGAGLSYTRHRCPCSLKPSALRRSASFREALIVTGISGSTWLIPIRMSPLSSRISSSIPRHREDCSSLFRERRHGKCSKSSGERSERSSRDRRVHRPAGGEDQNRHRHMKPAVRLRNSIQAFSSTTQAQTKSGCFSFLKMLHIVSCSPE
jgi:selenide,water dikinase